MEIATWQTIYVKRVFFLSFFGGGSPEYEESFFDHVLKPDNILQACETSVHMAVASDHQKPCQIGLLSTVIT